MPTNKLANEKSPYLLQHANNPVDWHPWGREAFEKARNEDKPIFLSIGYSTCHWCHVMERESFESDEIAEVLNRFFVPIKVDREERPDVDRIYMTFVQAATGSGGWPMSVWLTPDLKPFFGGTYFPPDSRWGRPGFRSILEQLATAWHKDRAQIVQSGIDVLAQLESMVRKDKAGRADAAVIDSGFYQLRRGFDSRYGGIGGAPKFPRPSAYNFLLRYAYVKDNAEARQMVLFTLQEMAKGGMNDQLGGGFHRYSVDARWFVPHFEKMLYDQAQLAISYLEAFQSTNDAQYARVARDIFEYVLRDMSHASGGFYSAEDADSVIDPAHPHEKGEGAFYIWSREELDRVLGQPVADWFSYRYGAELEGNVREDPHSEFTGRNILFLRASLEETAKHFGRDEAEVRAALQQAIPKLLEARSARVRPHLDDKILTAWNGLMISAFAKGAQVLGERTYLDAARRAVAFVSENMLVDGVLLRRWRDGEAAIPGFLDDYAFFVQGLLDLYEAEFDDAHLGTAIELTGRMRLLFEDAENGGFFSTTETDASLVMRMQEDYDGAEPSGNSIAILNLLRLWRITGDESYSSSAERALDAFGGRMAAAPVGLPQMLVALMHHLEPPRQVVLAGDGAATLPFAEEFHKRFLPFHTLLNSTSEHIAPHLREMKPVAAPAAAYVCQDFTCQLPVTELADFGELLK